MYIYAFYLYFLQSVPALAPLSVSPPLRASRQLLLRLADFCKSINTFAKIGALRHSRLPASSAGRGRCSCPRGGSQVTIVNSGKVDGQAKKQESLPHHKFLSVYGRNLAPPWGSWREAPERGEKQQKEKRPLARALSSGLSAGFYPLYNFCEKECSLTPGLPARSGCGCGGPASQGRGRSRRRWGR